MLIHYIIITNVEATVADIYDRILKVFDQLGHRVDGGQYGGLFKVAVQVDWQDHGQDKPKKDKISPN
jgi:hypothetical protein